MTILRLTGSGLALLPLLASAACSDSESEGDNQAPVIEAVTAEMDEDSVLELDLLSHVSDGDGDALSLILLKTGSGHRVELRPDGKVAVTPLANFHGRIEIPFKVTDKRFIIPGTATVTVRSVNDAPVGTTEKVIPWREDATAAFLLSGADVEGDALTFTVVGQPAHGALRGTPPELVYTPSPNFYGDEVIRYQVSDGAATSAVEELTLRVNNENDAPVAPEQPLSATEDTSAALTLQATDPDGDALSFFVTQQPQHGTLLGSGKDFTYQPAANYYGADQITFFVTDGQVSSTRVIPISVAPVDDAPTAAARFGSNLEDHNVNISLVGADVDSPQLEYLITTQPAHGSLSGTAPDLLYTPAADYHGSDSFTYVVTADGLTSAPATVSLSLSPVNDAPRPVNQTLTLLEDGNVSFTISAVDPDSSNLTYSNSTLPDDGTLSGTGTSRNYRTHANASGTRTFTFSVFDGQVRSYGTVTFLITAVNDAPVARADFVATAVNEALQIPVLANDVDADGEVLSIDDVGEAAHGQVAIAGDKLQYTPADGYSGTDQVTYTVVDAAGVTASATVTVGVGEFPAGAPDEPLPFEVAHAGNSWSSLSLSADGRFLVFSSTSRVVPQDDNDREDVYVYERGRRILRLASATVAGIPGNASSTNAQISGNGRYVVFESSSSNLVPGGTSLVNVFRKDLVTGAVAQISVTSAGEGGNGESWEPKISDDGNRVVFSSMAFNLWPGDSNGAADIFLRDVAAGTTSRMSLSRTGSESDQESTTPVISGNGAVVAFTSKASNLVDGDSNGVADVFVREVVAGVTSRVSITTNGVQGDYFAHYPSLSRDGRYVSFISYASNFGEYNPGYYSMVYVRDRVSATTIWQAYLTTWPQLSGDGRYLSGEDQGYWNQGAALRDRFASTSTIFPSNEGILATSLSGNGRYLAYTESLTGTVHLQPNPY